MESIISSLTRASQDVQEPRKSMLLSVVAELSKLKSATTRVLEQLQIEEEGEISLQEFVGQLEAISSVAEEPLGSWLGGIGKALLFLGDVMAMPPPALPKPRNEIQITLDLLNESVVPTIEPAPAMNTEQDKLGTPEYAQTALSLCSDSIASDHNTALLPQFFTSGTREAPIELPDSPIIKSEPGEESEEMPPLEQKQLLRTESALPLSSDHKNVSVQHPSPSAVPTHPKALNSSQEFKLNDHHGGVTIGKPSQCERCNEKFPSRKKMLAHIAHKHPDHPQPLWNTRRLDHTEPENVRSSFAVLQPARGRKRAWSGPGGEQRQKRRGRKSGR